MVIFIEPWGPSSAGLSTCFVVFIIPRKYRARSLSSPLHSGGQPIRLYQETDIHYSFQHNALSISAVEQDASGEVVGRRQA